MLGVRGRSDVGGAHGDGSRGLEPGLGSSQCLLGSPGGRWAARVPNSTMPTCPKELYAVEPLSQVNIPISLCSVRGEG